MRTDRAHVSGTLFRVEAHMSKVIDVVLFVSVAVIFAFLVLVF